MTDRLPRIGITTSLNTTDTGAREQRIDLAYVRAIERAGGLPILVPMVASEAALRELLGLLDALVVTGGPAVVEGLVGTLPDDIDPTDPDRTASDVALLSAFLEARRPALGICYGMQLGNALLGGQIYADVERQVEGTAVHSRGRGGTVHPVTLSPDSRLRQIVGRDAVEVNTRHVQAIATLADGLRMSARAHDGTIEALERPDGSFLGVQFHPEAMEPPLDAVFKDLVERARAYVDGAERQNPPIPRTDS